MTELKARLLDQISREGPMGVADFMTACLLHPTLGYYATRDPLGASGDFVTAPEVSQMFGELLGLWLAQCWLDQGRPDPFLLVELGPGRGTLMADALRATQSVPGFAAAMRLHLVEASPVLRRAQETAVAPLVPVFHDSVADLPDGPLFLLANEFLDALPIRQFQRTETGWRERQVGASDGRLIWGLAPDGPHGPLEDRLIDTEPGQIVETCAPAEAIVADVGRRIEAEGGAALFCDYGDWESIGDTLQAVAHHNYVDPFEAPGQSDVTAHVAFAPLAMAARPARASALVRQGVFLERLGITARAQALAQGLDGAALTSHIAAHRRLTHPQAMGHLFKMLALTPTHAPAPPALEDDPR